MLLATIPNPTKDKEDDSGVDGEITFEQLSKMI